ncbi:MAG: hypothetical protein SFV53_04050 [Rickettsiales bacterium]|nr:hypothetical protein [Rickettsiales bacterium]
MNQKPIELKKTQSKKQQVKKKLSEALRKNLARRKKLEQEKK